MSYELNKVSAGDFEIEYVKFGNGEKPLVILPGLSVQSVLPAAPAIEKQYEIFANDYTVYLLERRTKLPPVYSVYDMADDTAQALEKLGLKNVCLFGTSQGGMIAMTVAAKHPHLVGKLALGSTAVKIDEQRCAVINNWVSLAEIKDKEGLYLSFGEKVYPKEFFEKNREAFVSMAKTVKNSDLERFVILAKGTNGFDITDSLSRIECPVLAIGDSSDSVLGANASLEIAEAFKNKADFELYMYNGFGHAAYDTAPDYTERLYTFFSE